jgi:NAD(P)-dependent dehydrogenase (short-subunit alcohol dehydrogenase family)
MGWSLVTGGGKRIGAEICRALAQLGHSLAIHYRASEREALQLAEECRRYGVSAEIIQGDFSSKEETRLFTKRYLERFIETEHIVHNVGNYFTESLLETPFFHWEQLFQENLFAPELITRALLPSLKRGGGTITSLGVAGLDLKAASYATLFTMTKACLLLWTKTLAKELAREGIRVNMVSPGLLDISIDLDSCRAKVPLGRVGSSEEVARAVAFLVDEKSSYITGQNLEVAGGLRL